MTKVFIDGSAGTAGLQIHQRLESRPDVDLITIPYEKSHDANVRSDAINASDVAFLCLPDDAARESASLVKNDHTILIDTSTAHRTDEGWTYGFPELKGQREAIMASRRIANPGCHASGFIVLTQPLVQAGILPPEVGVQCFSLTGYSGGGKKMIAEYEAPDRPVEFDSGRVYGLTQNHKHLKEMVKISGLTTPPIFCPVIADYYCGMETVVTLFRKDLRGSAEDIREVYRNLYQGPVVFFDEEGNDHGILGSNQFAQRDDMTVTVCGNDDRIVLISRFDNLGKGASGAAVQNFNLVTGQPETAGLKLGGDV